jgi:GT2 family glycosyltransferase
VARVPPLPGLRDPDAEITIAPLLRASLLRLLLESLRQPARDPEQRLAQVRDALGRGALDDALRNLDRAWRCEPENAAMLAPIYGRLLLLEGTDDAAALNLLSRAIELTADAEGAALIAVALLRLERPLDARRQLESSLADYCVAPGGLLWHAAGEVMHHPAVAAPGWMGRGFKLEFLGELDPADASSALDVRVDGGAAFAQIVRRSSGHGAGGFSFRVPRLHLDAGVEVESRGLALLGSGARLPPTFALDGRMELAGRCLSGWARIGWSPTRALRLRIDDGHVSHRTRTSNAASASHVQDSQTSQVRPISEIPQSAAGTFEVDLCAAGLGGDRIEVSAQLPDGRWQPLPDSPLLLESAVRLKGLRPRRALARDSVGRHSRSDAIERAPRTDVIVPVYGGREATLACLESVLATLDDQTALVVVDDATEDLLLIAALDRWAADGRITLLRNPVNEGFAASVNRGLALHATHDALVLNSDTLVCADWLPRLREAAYGERNTGTVTPFSNSGSIASYPDPRELAIDPSSAAALQTLAAATLPGVRADIPVGVGFCLYLRRDCLQDVGTFDAAVFGDGYGEETDFCMRARARGWSHRLAADVFVYHAGGLSFGSRRAALLHRSQRLVNLRHPGYDRFIADFLAEDPLRPLRRRLDERRLLEFEGRFVLVLTLALAGGVERFVNERCAKLRAQGFHPLILRPAAAGDARRCELVSDALALPNLRYDIPEELPALEALLRSLGLAGIEIQHFLHLDARLIERVLALRVPYEAYVHDYAWICPRITLIDESGRYCGEPEVAVCEACVRKNGSELGESMAVTALRARSAGWLRGARRVIAPSADTAARLGRYFGGLTVDVETPSAPEPAPALVTAPAPIKRRDPTRPCVRVALIGAIGEHKGYRVLLDCARDARARSLPLEFLVIGYTEDDARLQQTGRVFITGRYGEGEPPHLLRREDPDVLWLPSVWPETWCYALDYALGSALPVAAFDLGAIAERLRGAGRGELLPLGAEPGTINDRLLKLGGAGCPASVTASRSDKTPLAAAINVDIMNAAHSEDEPMVNASDEKTPEVVPTLVHDEGLAASVQVLPLAAGLYLFSVKPQGRPAAAAGGRLKLPAMHVGLGPGVPPDQVEFMAGAGAHGAWLLAPTDLLIVKINGVGATLILNSVRAPDGAALSIKVERLNRRPETADVPTLAVRADTAPGAGASSVAPMAANALADAELPLAVQIGVHIRARGDMTFTSVPWAGRVAPGLWIESFAVRPLERFEAKDLEYKALTGGAYETPWLSDGAACGTQRMGVPLVAFALRFRAGAAAGYDCEYSGYFHSGITVGPLRNGVPCRSTVANDPLEGIQVRLVKRAAATSLLAPADGKPSIEPASEPAAAAATAASARTGPAVRPRPAQRHSARGS